jgi:YbgC/YbaW family acyl-CoA thioester hydrolase
MSTVFTSRRRVEFVDTDMAGIVHFSNFFRWMESAEVDYLHARGLTVRMAWEGQHLGFPRVSASCDYLKPIRFEEMIDIAVSIQRLGEKSVTYAFEFTRDGESVARGKVVAVCCRVREDKSLESVEIPATLRERLLSASGGHKSAGDQR